MSFIEERLFENVETGYSGGPTWRTLRKELRSGIVRRKVTRSRPIRQYSASFDRRDDETLEILLAAFNATFGAAFGFRFKDWLDYQLIDEPFGAGTGSEETRQLEKAYTFGSQSTLLPIRKPNSDVVVFADGQAVPTTVDTTTGLVTFTAPLGSMLTLNGTYDIPVMFENDEFSAVIESRSVNTIDVQIIEDLSA